ncbi:MAG: tetratricopeptide repeat protein, partial [Flavobacteriales bacterium]
MLQKTLAFVLLFFCMQGVVRGQWDKEKKKETIKDAAFYFENENYLAALPLYKELVAHEPKELEYSMRCGICYLYKTDEKTKSVQLIEKVLSEAPKTEDVNFYLGRAYHLNSRFNDAIEQFNLAKQKKTSKKNKELIGLYVDYCNNAKELTEHPVNVSIENI